MSGSYWTPLNENKRCLRWEDFLHWVYDGHEQSMINNNQVKNRNLETRNGNRVSKNEDFHLQKFSINILDNSSKVLQKIFHTSKNRTDSQVKVTSMASTKYSERIDIHAVKTVSQIIDSHLEISGASSSSEVPSVWESSWNYAIYLIKKYKEH